jgi:hypothetical protein
MRHHATPANGARPGVPGVVNPPEGKRIGPHTAPDFSRIVTPEPALYKRTLGLRAADLVFDPTLACCEGDAPVPAAQCATAPNGTTLARVASSPPVPDSRGLDGQGLPLSRTMLSDHKSPYVGRFACDWPRLSTTDPHAAHPNATAGARRAGYRRAARGRGEAAHGPRRGTGDPPSPACSVRRNRPPACTRVIRLTRVARPPAPFPTRDRARAGTHGSRHVHQ